MLLSELVGKEIINLNDGGKLGAIGQLDLVISPDTGEIEALNLPDRGGIKGLWGGEREQLTIPWSAVKKIGSEVIIVDLTESYPQKYTV